MKREYWDVPEDRKKTLTKTIIKGSPFVAYTLIVYKVIYINVLRVSLVLIYIVLLMATTLDGIRGSRKRASHPVCRFTNDFIVLDYDRKVIPLETVTRIVVDLKRRITKIWYPTIKDSLIQKYPEEHSHIRGKWMSNWDSFLEDLKSLCKGRSIEMKRMSS
ncbi:MAG: hypothetical protein HXS44_17050 [Theionarchaea archaeon]|nr:hypothetical protein [Theionarchaea archaeon]